MAVDTSPRGSLELSIRLWTLEGRESAQVECCTPASDEHEPKWGDGVSAEADHESLDGLRHGEVLAPNARCLLDSPRGHHRM